MPDLSTLTIQDAARLRWQHGRVERGLAEDAPFEGDPIAELRAELADAWNYVCVAEGHGALNAVAAGALQHALHGCYVLLDAIKQANEALKP